MSDNTATKTYRDGTHRTEYPSRTLARVRPHMADMGITRIANLTGLDRLGIPVVGVYRPNSRSVAVSQGKGLHLDASKASGLMEAVETFHAETIAEPPMFACLEAMRHDHGVIDVGRLPSASRGRLPPDQQIAWIDAQVLGTGDKLYVPYELVSTDYTLPHRSGYGFFQATTNGLASGNHVLEAVLHAICELVERDATALWWHRSEDSRAARAIDLASVEDEACRSVLDKFAMADIDVTVWETTTDIGIAAFLCAVSGREGPPLPEFGAGCNPCREIALLRSLTEAAQARVTFISGARDDISRAEYTRIAVADRSRRLRRLMKPARITKQFCDGPSFSADTIAEDLDHVADRLATVGLDQVAIVDLTRDKYDIAVVRAVIPGIEGLIDDSDYHPGSRARSVAGAE